MVNLKKICERAQSVKASNLRLRGEDPVVCKSRTCPQYRKFCVVTNIYSTGHMRQDVSIEPSEARYCSYRQIS